LGSRGKFLGEESSKFKVENLKGRKLNVGALRAQRREWRAVSSYAKMAGRKNLKVRMKRLGGVGS
jgi:hypothetical protein